MLGRRFYRRPRIVQPGGRSPGWVLILILLLTYSAGLAWLAFDYGRQRAGFDSAESSRTFERLEQRIQEVTLERERLRDRAAILERSSQIDTEAARGAQEQIKTVQDQNLELEQELAFLRGILKADDAQDGVRVHELKIEKLREDRSYNFSFTVSQLTKNSRTVTGKIYVSVGGATDGEIQEQGLAELTTDGIESLKMRFRYFQNVTGQIRLPEGFSPRRFTVNVKPASKDHPSVTQVFDWAPEE